MNAHLAASAAVVALTTLVCVSGEGQKSGNSESVGCFTCQSYNKSDPNCMDPFNATDKSYTSKCETGMKGRVGSFPAHYCIKMDGVSLKTGIQVTVRTCALKTMHQHCGTFDFDEEEFSGCLTTCETNGCNRGSPSIRGAPLWGLLLLCLSVLSFAEAHGSPSGPPASTER